jgi:thiopurine S-methyltransferase
MDRNFWHERWQKKETGFHQPAVNDLLQLYWPRLGLEAGSEVFVPLCGRSLDMVWLAEQGHRVIGAELSQIAIDEFFAERGLTPEVSRHAGFTIKSAGAFELWRGDFFELPPRAVAGIASAYDRASLIAFPADMQGRYAAKLKELAPAQVPLLLITLDYDQKQMTGPPFSTPRDRVHDLFADRYEIEELACRSALEQNPRLLQRGLTSLEECAYVLRPI